MIYALLCGAIAMGCWAIGLFFLRFWVASRDRLFLIFTTSFWLLGIERIFPILTDFDSERNEWQYLLRLVAFVLILFAILDKNLKSKKHKNS